MKKLFVLALLTGPAQATTLDFGVSYPLSARVGLSDLRVLGGQVDVGAGLAGLDINYSRGLTLPPLGVLSVGTRAQLAWKGGGRLGVTATGVVGPVALNLAASAFSTPATTFDPLAGWAQEPTDLRGSGWNTNLSLLYRVRRDLVATLGTELGPQNNVYGNLELHRDLMYNLPPAEGDDPAAPPETERIGTLNYRLGARAGKDVLGLTAGISYAIKDGTLYTLDAQAGPTRAGHAGLGLVASASWPDKLGEGSTLGLYAAYEPWRVAVSPLRFGLEASKSVGPGTLSAEVRGGQNPAGQVGFGVGLRYQWPLGGAEQP